MKRIYPLVSLLVLAFSAFAQPTRCDSLASAMSGYNAAYPNGSNLWTFTGILNDSLGGQHYDSASSQNISNTASYWMAQLQKCGLSCPGIVSCGTVSSQMSSFLSQYPQYDSAAPDVTWSTYLNENGAGTDVMGITNWWYTPDEWRALFVCCGVSAPPVPVSLLTRCDTMQAVLGVIPGVGSASFNQNNLINELNAVYGGSGDLAYWFPQLLACGDSCSQIVSCSSFSSAMDSLGTYVAGGGTNGPYSVPFAEGYLGIVFQGYSTMDTASWDAVFSCCQPSHVNYGSDTMTYCEQLELMRIQLEYILPGHSCLPSWLYNYALSQFLPQMPQIKDSNITQLCAELTTCKVTCLSTCDEAILTSCDSVNSVAYVYRVLLKNEGVTVDTAALNTLYALLFGQSLPYSAIMSQINNCNPNDTAVLTEIVYTAQNVQYTTSGTQTYIEFDLFATDTPTNLLFSQGNIYVQYDSTIFGTNLVGNGLITATKGMSVDSPYYNLSLSDSTSTMLKIAMVHTPSPAALANLDSISQQLCHLKIDISGFNLSAVGAYFDTLSMAHRSAFKFTPSGLEFPYDRILVNGLVASLRSDDIDAQITNVSYTSSYPVYLTFNVQIEAVDPLHDADVSIAYNIANFGTSPTLSCTKSSGLGIYDFSAGASSGTIDLALSPGSSYPTTITSDQYGNIGTFPVPNDFSTYTTIATCSLTVVNCCYASGAYISTSAVSGEYALPDGVLQDDGNGDYWYDIDADAYSSTGVSGSFDNSSHGICPSGATPNITGISPTTIDAGTFSVLTIDGSGFGCDKGVVLFRNSNDGGASTMHTQTPDIQTWQDDQITVWVPGAQDQNNRIAAGSGAVQIQTSVGDLSNQSATLTIPYAALNIRDASNNLVYVGLANDNGTGAYNMIPSTGLTSTQLSTITQAMNDWDCNIGVQLSMTSPSSSIIYYPGDGVCSVTFGSLSSGTAALTLATVSQSDICSAGTVGLVTYISDIDIEFSNEANLFYPDLNGSVPSGELSLWGTARHEFGHGLGLLHVDQTSDLMYYLQDNGDLGTGLLPISGDDHNGGMYLMSYVSPSVLSLCYSQPAIQSFPAGCGSINGINSISENPFNLNLYPNPFNDYITVSGVLDCGRDIKIGIMDVLGQFVYSNDLGIKSGALNESLNVSSFASGIYIVKVSIDDQTKQFKIVKK